MASPRMTEDEVWSFVAGAHTGILTTLRRDGMPISMPLWFACIDRVVYLSTRGKKLARIARDPRASFLVETGAAWADLKAVHLTGRADVIDPEPGLLALVEAETARKYDTFRTPAEHMPPAAAEVYARSMRWVRFIPDTRVLQWDNSKLVGGTR
jgi:nitroimidazol reductase NimA-like FMN-containing flavoprotein (pyridoxamine 5'-phosphate oxidase superfamily)